jgi:hypothetical protein
MAILAWKGGSEVLHFDVTLAETSSAKSDVTKFPVEKGADFSDHVRVLPADISLKVKVSNSPLRNLPKATTEVQALRIVRDPKRLALHAEVYDRPPGPTPGAVVTKLVSIVGDALFGEGPDFKVRSSAPAVEAYGVRYAARKRATTDDRRIELLDKLETLRATRELIDVYTTVGYYPERWLSEITYTRNKPTDGLEIDLKFEVANVVETTRVKAPKTRVSRAKAPEVAGAPTAEALDPSKVKSLLKKLLGT